MAATTLDGVLLKGVAGSRPAASAVAKGTIYSATDTGAITQSDGVSTWSTFATITGAGHLASATARRTSGSLNLTSTSEANLDTGLDLTLAAATGDVVTCSINGLHGTESIIVNIDVATIVSAAPVNYFGVGLASSNQGLLGWSKQAAVFTPIGGSATYVLQAGDISGGNVVLRLRYKCNAGTGSTLYATTALALQFSAILIRPV